MYFTGTIKHSTHPIFLPQVRRPLLRFPERRFLYSCKERTAIAMSALVAPLLLLLLLLLPFVAVAVGVVVAETGCLRSAVSALKSHSAPWLRISPQKTARSDRTDF